MAISFEQAFDSRDHKFLLNVLHSFNFGPSFIQWIRTFYLNVSCYIKNYSFATNYFSADCRVRQGDPLYHLLFILSLEIMACSIRQNYKIQGIKMKNEEVKLSSFC